MVQRVDPLASVAARYASAPSGSFGPAFEPITVLGAKDHIPCSTIQRSEPSPPSPEEGLSPEDPITKPRAHLVPCRRRLHLSSFLDAPGSLDRFMYHRDY